MLNLPENTETAGKPSVLHIDDDEFALDLFKLKYGKWFDITSAEKGTTALELIAEKHFEVIITDYDMPELDGLGLLQIINEKHPGIPVIFFTGQGNETVARDAFLNGAFDYFVKDFHAFAQTEKLIYAVKKALDSRKSAQALAEKDTRYAELMEIIPHAIVFTDSERNIRLVNRQFESITGNSGDKYSGVKIEEIFNGEDREKILRLWENQENSGNAEVCKVKLPVSSGEFYETFLKIRKHASGSEKTELLFVFSQQEPNEESSTRKNPEISTPEQKKTATPKTKTTHIGKMETGDNDSAQKTAFRIALIYAVIGGLWILTSDGILGLLFQDPHTITTISTFKGWFYVGVTAWLLYLLISTNVKRVFETKEILAKAEAANRAILDSIPDPIFRVSGEGRVTDIREGNNFALLTGGRKQIKDMFLADASPDVYKAGWEFIRRTLASNEPSMFEFRMETHGGGKIDFEARIIPDSHGEAILIIREITLRKEMENRMLEQNRSLTEFAGIITNRLKTPIGIIGGFTSIIREQRELFDKYYDAIVSEVERINDMINNLLKMSSKENPKENRINVRLRDALSLAASETAGEDFILKVVAEDIKPEIFVEPEGFTQALKGVLSFAYSHWKHPGEDFALEVSYVVTSDHNSVIFDFETQGLTSDYINQLFDPSFSIKQGEMEFGLVLARSAVEIQGGKMDIKLDESTGRLTVDLCFEPKDKKS
ncbi:MAG: response regulator [Firmicutes bacterium]|nr:response regulator [Bacillota bacterium]